MDYRNEPGGEEIVLLFFRIYCSEPIYGTRCTFPILFPISPRFIIGNGEEKGDAADFFPFFFGTAINFLFDTCQEKEDFFSVPRLSIRKSNLPFSIGFARQI